VQLLPEAPTQSAAASPGSSEELASQGMGKDDRGLAEKEHGSCAAR